MSNLGNAASQVREAVFAESRGIVILAGDMDDPQQTRVMKFGASTHFPKDMSIREIMAMCAAISYQAQAAAYLQALTRGMSTEDFQAEFSDELAKFMIAMQTGQGIELATVRTFHPPPDELPPRV